MSLMYHDTVIAGTPVIDNTPTAGSNHAVSSGGVKSAITKVETDLASIHATGPTNTTGAAIAAGTYFYLAPQSGDDEILVQAKADIAVNATFTSGTNYETVTVGGLNKLKSAMDFSDTLLATTDSTSETEKTVLSLSQFKFVRLSLTNAGETSDINSVMIPTKTFMNLTTTNNSLQAVLALASGYRMGGAYFKNDTTIVMWKGSSSSSSFTARFYGVK